MSGSVLESLVDRMNELEEVKDFGDAQGLFSHLELAKRLRACFLTAKIERTAKEAPNGMWMSRGSGKKLSFFMQRHAVFVPESGDLNVEELYSVCRAATSS